MATLGLILPQKHIEHRGQHLKEICDECFEFRQAWTHLAGKIAGRAEILKFLQDEVIQAFINNHDKEAFAIRGLLKKIELVNAKDRTFMDTNYIQIRGE
jgi:hypothetical protein